MNNIEEENNNNILNGLYTSDLLYPVHLTDDLQVAVDKISVVFRLGDNECIINADPSTKISDIYPEEVIDKLGLKQEIEDLTVILDSVTMGHEEIEVELTWDDNGIGDGARLEIHKRSIDTPYQLLLCDSVPIDIICKISETLSLEPVGSPIEQITRIQEHYPNALNSYISLSDTLNSSQNNSDVDWILELGNLRRIAGGRNYKQSIIAVLNKLKTLPYYKNYPASSGSVHALANHEEAIAIQLKSYGFRKIVPSNRLRRDSVMNPETRFDTLNDVPNGSFIEQPFGTHQSPDFIVKVSSSIILFLEAKSSETTHPTYNSGTIEPHFIYIFCSKKTDQTTIFKGESIVTREQQRLLDQHISESRQRDKELNEQLKEIDLNGRGVCFYTRPMYNQSGGQEYTNYFTHSNRVASEEHAIEWVKEQCQNL